MRIEPSAPRNGEWRIPQIHHAVFLVYCKAIFLIEEFCSKECGAGNEDNVAFSVTFSEATSYLTSKICNICSLFFQLYDLSCAKPHYCLFKPTLKFLFAVNTINVHMLGSGTLPPFAKLYVIINLDFNCFDDEHTYFTICKGA